MNVKPGAPTKGRGAGSNPEGRFESRSRETFDDGWMIEEDAPPKLQTVITAIESKSIISRNSSPDIGFEQSINPYQGCEHGCIYCYARPSHGYLNLSAGLDFETRLFYKANAAELLERELCKPGYIPKVIALGANTDPYQPIEKDLKVTRSILEVLLQFRHPVGIVTKGVLIERDIDVLAEMARDGLASVGFTLTTLDPALKRTLEPRAASPAARLRVMRKLTEAGIPVRVMFSPVIPFINDAEMERILAVAVEAGATAASYVMLRLPHEVAPLFRDWLAAHAPLKAEHVMSLVQQSRGGKDYDANFATRMKGEGKFAELIAQRFALACRRLGLQRNRTISDGSKFRVPPASGDQIGLF